MFRIITPRRQRYAAALRELTEMHEQACRAISAPLDTANWYRAQGALDAIERAIDLLASAEYHRPAACRLCGSKAGHLDTCTSAAARRDRDAYLAAGGCGCTALDRMTVRQAAELGRQNREAL